MGDVLVSSEKMSAGVRAGSVLSGSDLGVVVVQVRFVPSGVVGCWVVLGVWCGVGVNHKKRRDRGGKSGEKGKSKREQKLYIDMYG